MMNSTVLNWFYTEGTENEPVTLSHCSLTLVLFKLPVTCLNDFLSHWTRSMNNNPSVTTLIDDRKQDMQKKELRHTVVTPTACQRNPRKS